MLARLLNIVALVSASLVLVLSMAFAQTSRAELTPKVAKLLTCLDALSEVQNLEDNLDREIVRCSLDVITICDMKNLPRSSEKGAKDKEACARDALVSVTDDIVEWVETPSEENTQATREIRRRGWKYNLEIAESECAFSVEMNRFLNSDNDQSEVAYSKALREADMMSCLLIAAILTYVELVVLEKSGDV